MFTNGMFVQAQYSTNTMFTSMELTKVLFVFAENFRKGCLMGFKDKLKEKRVEANLTQAALAEKSLLLRGQFKITSWAVESQQNMKS